MKKRLFTFGCSFTAYSWPSYADMFSIYFDEYQNWALAGLGNRAIAERIAECHATQNISKDDVVIVQWSTHLRNDFFSVGPGTDRRPGWRTAGSLFNYKNVNLYDQKWFDIFFHEPAYFMHTLNEIVLVQNLLNGTGCTWYMTSIGDLRNIGTDILDGDGYGENVLPFKSQTGDYVGWEHSPILKETYNKAIWGKHKNHWLKPLSVFCKEQMPNDFYEFLKGDSDFHPSTKQHAYWLLQELKPKFDFIDENRTLEIVEITDRLFNTAYKNRKSMEKHLYFSEELKNIKGLNWPNVPKGIYTC